MSQLAARTIACFHPLDTFTAPSATKKTSPQGKEIFRSDPAQGRLGPVFEVYGVLEGNKENDSLYWLESL